MINSERRFAQLEIRPLANTGEPQLDQTAELRACIIERILALKL